MGIRSRFVVVADKLSWGGLSGHVLVWLSQFLGGAVLLFYQPMGHIFCSEIISYNVYSLLFPPCVSGDLHDQGMKE